MLLPNHGANPVHFTDALGLPLKENSLDFSVNTNPFGPPKEIVENWSNYLELIEHYPDPHAAKLKHAIATKEKLARDNVLIGNGAAELIFLIANLFQGKNVAIVEPTFSEYRDACSAYRCHVESLLLKREEGWQLPVKRIIERLPHIDLLFICNPNNPTGVLYHKHDLDSIMQEAGKHGVTVVIDEAFYDFCESPSSSASLLPESNQLIILRSLTKMYSIAGIRLGYLLADSFFINKLKRFQHPWSVNGIAQEIGLSCLRNEAHAHVSSLHIGKERSRIVSELEKIGYQVSSSKVNFYLLTDSSIQLEMDRFLKFLIHHRIIPRHTYNFPGLDGKYVRLAVKRPQENDQLLDVLKRWKSECSSL